MQSTAIFSAAIFTAILVPIFVAICLSFLPLLLSGQEEKAQQRRLADARMNARLLRFNL